MLEKTEPILLEFVRTAGYGDVVVNLEEILEVYQLPDGPWWVPKNACGILLTGHRIEYVYANVDVLRAVIDMAKQAGDG